MSLITELTIEPEILPCLILSQRRIGRGRAPWPIIERQTGDHGAVLEWLTARAEALRHEGYDVRRTRFRQRRRCWAGKIAYDEAPSIGHPSTSPACPGER